ncbi:ATP-binding protein [Microcoleus sp. AR_TQ3_B6]|uniref:ATP-binding protein n=1 Tax=Microcoleus sp. AR_TQ3_B6 TaxID=3055284 RepID=UPI002FD45696
MLERIRLERFKKFSEVEVYLHPFTVLMGENSSGKTTVLQALNFSLIVLSTGNLVTNANGNIKVKKTGIGLPTLPGIVLADYRELFYSKISRGGTAKGAGGTTIELFDNKQNVYRLQIRSLFGNFNAKCTSSSNDLSKNPDIHTKPPLYISGFVGLLTSEERAFPVAIKDRLRSGQVSAIIRNLLLDTKEKKPDKFTRLEKRLADDFDFRLGNIFFEQQRDLYVTANYEEKLLSNRKLSLDFTSSGSGFMQVLQILAPIYRFCPDESFIVLLDEPDAHLHPNLQASLANALREIQKELNIQIIISTHSTAIIRSAEPSEVVPISSITPINKPLASSDEVEEQIQNRLDRSITTYDLGKSVISGKIIFFEDRDTSIMEAFDKAIGTKCFIGVNTAPMLKGRGKDDKVPFKLNEVLKEFVGQDIEIHYVRDGDGLSNEWRDMLANYATKYNVKLHQLMKHEIENYVLSPNVIVRALSLKHPSKTLPTEIEVQDKIKEFLKETIQLTRYNFNFNLEDSISKTAQLLNNSEYRGQACKSEASKLLAIYDRYNDFDDLVTVGMGKETLKSLLNWINQDLKLNLSKKDIIGNDNIKSSDVPKEIRTILLQLRSKVSEEEASDLSQVSTQETNDESPEDVDVENTE